MSKKKESIYSRYSWVFGLVGFVVAAIAFGGVAAAVTSGIYNNFTGDVTINQEAGNVSESPSLGAVTAVGGICDGSEPTTQLCNVNAYELESQTNFTASGSTDVSEFTQGGGVLATSTTETTQVLVESELLNYSYIEMTPNTGNLTLNLPATSTMTSLIPNAGDYRQWVVENATSTATTITLGAGTGIDLQEPDGQNVVIGQNNFAQLTCYRRTDTDVVCVVDETIPAD